MLTLLKQKNGFWAVENPETGEIISEDLTEDEAKGIIESTNKQAGVTCD